MKFSFPRIFGSRPAPRVAAPSQKPLTPQAAQAQKAFTRFAAPEPAKAATTAGTAPVAGKEGILGRFLALNPRPIGALTLAGHDLAALIRDEPSTAALRRALDRAQASGDECWSIAIRDRLIAAEPTDWMKIWQAESLIWAERETEAEKVLGSVGADAVGSENHLRVSVLLAARQRRFDDALALLKSADRGPGQARAVPSLITELLAAGRIAEAHATAGHWTAIFPKVAALTQQHIWTTALCAGFTDATALVDGPSGQSLGPEAQLALRIRLLLGHGRFEESLDLIAAALNETPTLWSLYGLAEQAALKSDRSAEYVTLIDRAAHIGGGRQDIRLLQVGSLADRGEFDAAHALLPAVREASEWAWHQTRLRLACQEPKRISPWTICDAALHAGVAPSSLHLSMAFFTYYFENTGHEAARLTQLMDKVQGRFGDNANVVAMALREQLARGDLDGAGAAYAALPKGFRATEILAPFAMYFAAMAGNDDAAAAGWQDYLRNSGHVALNARSSYPEPLSVKYRDTPGAVLAFATVFNGIEFVDWFLDYYRRLGVSHFFFTDNNSTDGTRERLMAEPDVSVFFNAGSFSRASCGVFWANHLMRRYGAGHWCFHLDMDEAFVFPNMDRGATLADLIAHLESEGAGSIGSMMLDIYPETLDGQDRRDPFEQSCYIDTDYSTLPSELPPYTFIKGGLRVRMTGRSLLMTKAPLTKFSSDSCYLVTNHQHAHLKMSKLTSVLLHYKFIGNIRARVDEAIARNEHFMGARFYKALQTPISSPDSATTLLSEFSRRYEGPKTLLRLGLMRSGPEWDGRFVHEN